MHKVFVLALISNNTNCQASSFIWDQVCPNWATINACLSHLLYVDPFETPCRRLGWGCRPLKRPKTVLIWSFSLDFEVILWANFMVVLVVSFLAMSHTNEEVSPSLFTPERFQIRGLLRKRGQLLRAKLSNIKFHINANYKLNVQPKRFARILKAHNSLFNVFTTFFHLKQCKKLAKNCPQATSDVRTFSEILSREREETLLSSTCK